MRNGMLAAALIVAIAPALRAEPPAIRSARVGLPDARNSERTITKFAAWSPIEVELTEGASSLVVEAPDADGALTVLKRPIHSGEKRAITYVRSAAGGEVTLHLEDETGKPVGDPFRVRDLRPKDALTYVVLGIGSRFSNFDLPKAATGAGEEEPTAGPLRGGRIALTAIESVDQLPDAWIGYDSVDVAILSTSSAEFTRAFAANREKREALQEWVLRGGRLVIAVGANANLVKPLEGSDLFPANVAGVQNVATQPLYWAARETGQSTSLFGNLGVKGGTFPVARFAARAGHAPRIVVPPASRPAELKDAVAIQFAVGLGRVTLLGFDLDRAFHEPRIDVSGVEAVAIDRRLPAEVQQALIGALDVVLAEPAPYPFPFTIASAVRRKGADNEGATEPEHPTSEAVSEDDV